LFPCYACEAFAGSFKKVERPCALSDEDNGQTRCPGVDGSRNFGGAYRGGRGVFCFTCFGYISSIRRGKENCISGIAIYRGLEYASVCEKGVTPLLSGKIREVKRCYWSRSRAFLKSVSCPFSTLTIIRVQKSSIIISTWSEMKRSV
jgi:hypothetical protein